MNNVLIVEAHASDCRVMSGLLQRAGYDPVSVDNIKDGKEAVPKLPPGAIIVTAMRLSDGVATEFINWLSYKTPPLDVISRPAA